MATTEMLPHLPHISDSAAQKLRPEQRAQLAEIEQRQFDELYKAQKRHMDALADIRQDYLESLFGLGLSEDDLVDTTPIPMHHEQGGAS